MSVIGCVVNSGVGVMHHKIVGNNKLPFLNFYASIGKHCSNAVISVFQYQTVNTVMLKRNGSRQRIVLVANDKPVINSNLDCLSVCRSQQLLRHIVLLLQLR